MTAYTIKQKMAELNFHPKKMLGQHFLINPQKVEQIVSTVKDLKPSFIMEVGPGLGVLTEHLLKLKITPSLPKGTNVVNNKSHFNNHSVNPFFCAVELDTQLCEYWKSREVSILEGDILKLQWQKNLLPGSVLIGNLPYQIASRLMIQCCPGPE